MNRQETEKLLTVILNAYPTFFRDFTPENFEIQANLWQNSLADCDYQDAVNAFKLWFNTEEYPPTLPKFKPVIMRFRNPSAFISPERAWEIVSDAVRKYGSYNSEQAFATFSEPIKRAVRNIGGWQKICQTELGRDWDFLRKNFIDVYQDFSQEVKEQELLPVSVLHRLQEVTGQKKQERLESK
jgi:hypothetical protein